MKAALFSTLGVPPEVLSLQDQPLTVLDSHEVQIQMTSIGLNRADYLFCEGKYFDKPQFPSRVGYEGAGIIQAVGPKVSRFKVGDRVGVMPCHLNASTHGCCAEVTTFHENHLLPTPSSVSDVDAGGFWMQYLTAWGAMVTEFNLSKGQVVVIPAASSSVGIAALQIAKYRGATSIATTTNPHKTEQLRELGADYVLNTSDPDYVKQVKHIGGGKGANLIFDPVAGDSIRTHIASAAPFSTLCIYGLLDRRPMDVHAGVLMKKNMSLHGFTIYSLYQQPKKLEQTITGVSKAFEAKALTPVVAKTFSLENIKDAFAYLASNQQVGKIIVTPFSERN